MKAKNNKILKVLLLLIIAFTIIGTFSIVNATENTPAEVSTAIDISNYVIYFSPQNTEWTGTEIDQPKITVQESWGTNAKTLTENVDYEVTYVAEDLTSIGAKKVTVTGIGKYTGSLTSYFYILPQNPQNLKIGTYTENQASFEWEAPNGDITYYQAYVYIIENNIVNIEQGPIKIEDLKYTVKNLKPGKKYKFTLNAITVVNSNYCMSIGGKEMEFITLPARPKNISVTPQSDTTSKISWQGEGTPTNEVYLYNNELSDYELLESTTEKYIIVDNSKLSEDYQIKIISYLEIDGEKIYSEEAIYTKGIVPQTPSGLAITQVANGLKLTWKKVNGVQGYKIYRSTSPSSGYKEIKTVSGTTTSFTDTGVTTGTTYYYKIRAYNTSTGSTYYSAYTGAKSKIMVKTTTAVSVTSYATSAKITWKKVDKASGYRVYRATSPNGKYVSVKYIKGNKTFSYTNKGLKKYKKYYYKVRAYYTKSGKNYYSSYSAYGTKAPLAKTTLSVSYNSKGYNTLKWKKVTGSKGYRIYRSTSKNGTYKRIKTITSGSKISYNDKSVAIGVRYWYKIVAYRGSLIGQYSNVVGKATGTRIQQVNKIKLKTKSSGLSDLDASMANLIKRATGGKKMSNYNKMKAVYTYIEKNLKHKNGYNCKHFAGTYSAALNYMGINSYCVSGMTTTTSGGWTAHTWVIYELNGTKYVLDPSIDRHIADSNKGKLQYQRFFKTESEVKKKYKKDGKTYAFVVDFSGGKTHKWNIFYN